MVWAVWVLIYAMFFPAFFQEVFHRFSSDLTVQRLIAGAVVVKDLRAEARYPSFLNPSCLWHISKWIYTIYLNIYWLYMMIYIIISSFTDVDIHLWIHTDTNVQSNHIMYGNHPVFLCDESFSGRSRCVSNASYMTCVGQILDAESCCCLKGWRLCHLPFVLQRESHW